MSGKCEIKEVLGLAARLAAGGVFIYAGFLKASAPAEEFAYAIESYRVLPAALTLPAALAVPWLELYLGVFLTAGIFIRQSAFCVIAMLLGFEGLLLQALVRGLPVTSCGCFGASGSNSLGHEFVQNLAFLALAALALKYGGKFSLDSLIDAHE
ncbi:MAG: hypothetical protein A2X28_11060 [Elusimicrobia bacterium GWA2_56_46]|nr:MAG: hypothetical protein A2X28_11060 [Elusimicrobia bacterium GWA2_56_46]OGR54138.1 MAG: hypothetical protein A2X39_05435 [Elusimicrobia bacterium GWC2_56_31]HBW23854.1 DoxX family protein [Elusimicrobiota bacterium]